MEEEEEVEGAQLLNDYSMMTEEAKKTLVDDAWVENEAVAMKEELTSAQEGQVDQEQHLGQRGKQSIRATNTGPEPIYHYRHKPKGSTTRGPKAASRVAIVSSTNSSATSWNLREVVPKKSLEISV
ncbi:hypothetical protein LTR86_009495 [Recurvomyces mirabilis]|nr:hypothetical protein LTR86_009495 [Recurvomyces mirabilis]